jgi:hypothetical protein
VIALFTDFGLDGPYTGQMKAVLAREAPAIPVIDLLADAPPGNVQAGAYLLAAFAPWFPEGTVFAAVVDPGVGSDRAAIAIEADGRWYVGPDNGLFELILRRARHVRCFAITWRPEALSASFHGRDLFAPVAARIARNAADDVLRAVKPLRHPDWPDDLADIVYIDRYGNAMTGLRAATLPADARLGVGGKTLPRARTFADVPAGQPFWYENANGLAEIAVNRGRADQALALAVGSGVRVSRS